MDKMSIKLKLLILFVVIKVIPLVIMFYFALIGALRLEEYLNDSTKVLFEENIKILENTTDVSIQDSIMALDDKSQNTLEKASSDIANMIALFLYGRDADLLFLSKLNLNQGVLQSFYDSKKKDITLHGDYFYDDATGTYITNENTSPKERKIKTALLKDNAEKFNYYDPHNFKTKNIPIYKEIVYFNTEGKELYKVSQINKKLNDVSKRENTYVNSEYYFNEIKNLKQGEIYVSDVIGEYVGTKIVGTFNKANAAKQGIDFEPEKYAYSGLENPVGKKFEGIVRFITPVFKNGKKEGYVSLALDHQHLREFTATYDTVNQYNKQNIIDATYGNYAFIWDHEGKSIVHPRDHSIMGYDRKTGQLAKPWLSTEVSEAFKKSGKPIYEFLKTYPKFDDQGWHKKPDLAQIKEEGLVGLDCRYLNHAPQCQGWMQLTENGGYGSFIINWTGVKKLTTAATIPYWTGKYKDSPRGFGFVAIGANVDDFHAATNKTKENIEKLLDEQTDTMKKTVDSNTKKVDDFIDSLLNELTVATVVMVLLVIAVAIWMSKGIISKINNLLEGTKKFANKEFDHKIKITSKDEIGELEKSFNDMAEKINILVKEQEDENKYLENELYLINQDLEKRIDQTTQSLRETMLKLQNADKVKSNFLSNIGHEMRTPLNAIIGFLEILKEEEKDDSKLKHMSIIASNSKTLLSIINDIIEVTKISSGDIRIVEKSTTLSEIVAPQIEYFEKASKEKGLILESNIKEVENIQILADRIHLRQVLSQILNNAIKFTQSGSIEFSLTKLEESKKHISMRFQVKDTGVGISADKIDKIFDLFTQADEESNRKFEGIGLGLNLCIQVLSLFDSTLKVESQEGVGSTFWFDIKFEKCSTGDKKRRMETILKKAHLLVVNDKPIQKELMKHIFKELDVGYSFVSNIANLKEIGDNSLKNVVLVDYEELQKVAQNCSETIDSQILLLTNSIISKSDYETSLSGYNIIGCVKKPLRVDELKNVLQNISLEDEEETDVIIDVQDESVVNIADTMQLDDSLASHTKERETVVEKPSFEPYKKEDAIKQLHLDEETVDMLLESFLEALDDDIQKIQTAIDAKDADAISKAAHYLKGSCSNLAMKEAVSILFDIEKRGKEGEIEFDLAELKDALQRVRDIINT